MKKIYVLVLLFFVVSCGGDNNVITEEQEDIKVSNILEKNDEEKIQEKIVFGQEIQDFTHELSKNPDIIFTVVCNEFKEEETIKYCLEKQQYFTDLINNS